jgi:hypothetical protein
VRPEEFTGERESGDLWRLAAFKIGTKKIIAGKFALAWYWSGGGIKVQFKVSDTEQLSGASGYSLHLRQLLMR